VPDLFWNEQHFVQFLAGLGAGLLFADVCFISYYLDSKGGLGHDSLPHYPNSDPRFLRVLVPDLTDDTGESNVWRKMRWHLAVTWLPLVILLMVPAVVYVSTDWPWAGGAADYTGYTGPYWTAGGAWVTALGDSDWCLVFSLPQRWPFLLGAVAAVLLIPLFVFAFRQVRLRGATLAAPLVAVAGRTARWERLLHLAVALAFGVVLLIPSCGDLLPSPASIAEVSAGPDGKESRQLGMSPAPLSTLGRCFLVGLWAGTHAAIVATFRLAQSQPPLGLQLLAVATFAWFFVLYEALFVAYWVGHGSGLAYLVSPALVICLLLALLVTAHGFLRFYFRRRYLPVLLLVLTPAWVVLGLLPYLQYDSYNLTFPNLESYYHRAAPGADRAGNLRGHVADLTQVDLQDVLAQMEDEANEDPSHTPTIQQRLDRLLPVYRHLRARVRNQVPVKGQAPREPDQDPADVQQLLNQYRNMHLQLAHLECRRLEAWKAAAGKGGGKPVTPPALRAGTMGLLASPGGAGPLLAASASFAEGPRPVLAVVAVSRAAYRAALWTACVLDRLEREPGLKDFAAHVRVITGASGGMVGAAYGAASLKGPGGHFGPAGSSFAVEKVGQDSLTPVTQSILFTDLPTLFVPFPCDTDRGRVLERTWTEQFDGVLDQPFGSLAEGEAAGWRPSLIVSPMLVEDGRRLLISNLYVPFLKEESGALVSDERETGRTSRRPVAGEAGRQVPGPRARPKAGASRSSGCDGARGPASRYSLSAVEFLHLFPDAWQSFRVTTAVRMSASFPYVSPAVDLPTTPRRRAVDAGYYDNYGVDLAARWIHHYRDWLKDNTAGVVLIQIRDAASTRRTLQTDQGRQDRLLRNFDWLTGPLVGANAARESVMAFRNDEQVRELSDFFNTPRSRSRFTTAVFEYEEEAASTWYLSKQDRAHILQGFRHKPSESANAQALDKLTRWWKGRETEGP
jgi:hypothetical protein